jgi:DNA polymerase III sliding clamp (beta) subunit (PCNA family)
MRGDPKIIRLSKDMAKALSVRDAHSLLIDGDLAGVVSLCDTGEPLNAKTALAFQAQELIIDGRFPDWRRVVPSAPEKSAHFAVAGKYVADMTSAMSLTIAKIKGRTTTNPCLRVFAESDNEPILCRGSDPNAFGVLMPMRLPEMAATEILPDWL